MPYKFEMVYEPLLRWVFREAIRLYIESFIDEDHYTFHVVIKRRGEVVWHQEYSTDELVNEMSVFKFIRKAQDEAEKMYEKILDEYDWDSYFEEVRS